MRRDLQRKPGALAPGAAIGDIPGEAALAGIEVDGDDALAGFHECDGNVHRRRGFTRPAFFITDHDHMRGSEKSGMYRE